MSDDFQKRPENSPLIGEITAFKRDILRTLAIQGPIYGLEVKRQLQQFYPGDVNHGRLYPNLDELEELGLIEIGSLDRRTNEYGLTDHGKSIVAFLENEYSEAIKELLQDDGGDQ